MFEKMTQGQWLALIGVGLLAYYFGKKATRAAPGTTSTANPIDTFFAPTTGGKNATIDDQSYQRDGVDLNSWMGGAWRSM
jgi:hypothetical protein